MTRIKKYGEVTVLYSKRVPLSKYKIVSGLVEKFLAKYEVKKTKLDGKI